MFCTGQTPNPRAICDRCSGVHSWPEEDRRFLLALALNALDVSPEQSEAQDHITLGLAEDGSPVTLDAATRNRHLYIIGRTGSGKSSLLRNLVMQDMDAGRGVVFLDPHGDTARQLCGYVPESRIPDVIYFCPTEPTCPAFNVLAADAPPYKLAADVLSALAMFFGFDAGSAPRMIHLLRQSLLTLLFDRAHEPHALADLRRILVDEDYRRLILDRTTEPDLLTFWRHEYPKFPKDASLPILNKLSGFLTAGSPLARLFSSTENALDLRAIMDGGKILLCNLSKGELGEAAAFLTGGLITTAIAQAALARASMPEAQRRDVFFYVDEFQNFAIDSFESILSEARKYRLNLTIAHQYLDQVPSKLQAAIFGNVAAMVCLPISAADAGVMQREMSSTITMLPYRPPFVLRFIRHSDLSNQVIRFDTGEHRERWRRDIAVEALALLQQDWSAAALLRDDELRTWFESAIGRADFGLPPLIFFRRSDDKDAVAEKFRNGFLNELRGAVEILSDPNRYPNVLIDPQNQKNTSWPEREDFVNLAALHGFVKIGTAKNTKAFSIRHPDKPPNEALARRIISPPARPAPPPKPPRQEPPPRREQPSPAAEQAPPPKPPPKPSSPPPAAEKKPPAPPPNESDDFLN